MTSDTALPVELLPCPFCGGEGAHQTDTEEVEFSEEWIGCLDCGATTAVDVWNTRALSATRTAVRHLAWEEPSRANNLVWNCKTIIGSYCIHIDGGRHMAWWEGVYSDRIDTWDGPERGSLFEAQQDAQGHFNGLATGLFETVSTAEGE